MYVHIYRYQQQTLPKVLATEDDESVISSTIFSPFSIKISRLRIIPSLSIFGECRSTSRLSKFSKCNITFFSDSIKEYVQNLALLPGESHLPSPHSTKSFVLYFSTSFDYSDNTSTMLNKYNVIYTYLLLYIKSIYCRADEATLIGIERCLRNDSQVHEIKKHLHFSKAVSRQDNCRCQ